MSLATTVVAAKLAGRCADGLERGQGVKMHALLASQVRGNFNEALGKALCGAEPGRRSVGWTVCVGQDISCPRCNRAISRAGAAA